MLVVRPVPPTASRMIARVGEPGADPLGHGDGAVELRAGQEHGELLAAHARRRVDPAQVAAQQLGERPQRLVAGGVPAAVVDALEVVEVGEEERQRGVEPARAGDLALERLDEAAAVDEAGELVGDGLLADDLVQACVLERDRGLRGEPLGERGRLGREAAFGRVDEQPDLAAARRLAEVELDRLLADRLADPRQLAVVVEHAAAGGAGRLDGGVEDHRQQPARVVGRRQRVADVRDRLARRPDPQRVRARRGARGTPRARRPRAGRT